MTEAEIANLLKVRAKDCAAIIVQAFDSRQDDAPDESFRLEIVAQAATLQAYSLCLRNVLKETWPEFEDGPFSPYAGIVMDLYPRMPLEGQKILDKLKAIPIKA